LTQTELLGSGKSPDNRQGKAASIPHGATGCSQSSAAPLDMRGCVGSQASVSSYKDLQLHAAACSDWGAVYLTAQSVAAHHYETPLLTCLFLFL